MRYSLEISACSGGEATGMQRGPHAKKTVHASPGVRGAGYIKHCSRSVLSKFCLLAT